MEALRSLSALLVFAFFEVGLALDFSEPTALEYWFEGARAFADQIELSTSAFPVLNFTPNLSAKVFDRLIREGRPFVVRGLLPTLPMKDWDCRFLRENALLKHIHGRREYGNESTSEAQWMSLMDILDEGGGFEPSEDFVREKSPYYVGLKDVLHDPKELLHDPLYSPTWSEEVLEYVQEPGVPLIHDACRLKLAD